jgi:hypothetical protein
LKEFVEMEIIPPSSHCSWLLVIRSKRGELARVEYETEEQAHLCAENIALAVEKEWDS